MLKFGFFSLKCEVFSLLLRLIAAFNHQKKHHEYREEPGQEIQVSLRWRIF